VRDAVVWAGPISGELRSVKWRQPTVVLVVNKGISDQYDCAGSMAGWTTEHTVSCIGSSAFGRLASSLGSDILGALLAKSGITDAGKVTLASFSAGHGLLNPILKQSADRVSAVMLFDSYYGATKEGYLAAAQRAVRGDCVMVVTASGFGGANYSSCNEYVKWMLQRIEPLDDGALYWPKDLPQPLSVRTRGSFLYADFGTTISHGEHAKLLAAPIIERWANPPTQGAPPWATDQAKPGGGPGGTAVIVGVGLVVAAGLAALAWRSKWKR